MPRWGLQARYDGVTGYAGAPGSGKSYSLAEKGLRALRAGREVWSNLGFEVIDHTSDCNDGWHTYRDEEVGRQVRTGVLYPIAVRPECVCEPRSKTYRNMAQMVLEPQRGAVLLCDDASSVFSSRDWQKFPTAVMYRLNIIRHDALEFHYSCITEARVDTVLREMTIWFWSCKRLPVVPVFSRAKWPPEEFRRAKGRSVDRQFVRLRQDVCDSYDHEAKFGVSKDMYLKVRSVSAEEWHTLEEWDELLKDELGDELAAQAEESRRIPGGRPRRTRSGRSGRDPGRRNAPAVERDGGVLVPEPGSVSVDLLRGVTDEMPGGSLVSDGCVDGQATKSTTDICTEADVGVSSESGWYDA